MMLRALTLILLIISASSCRMTEKLWEDAYEEKIDHFLVSVNGYYVVFVGEKYHYIFSDRFGTISQLLNAYNYKFVLLNSDETELEVEGGNKVKGNIVFDTVDLDLTRSQYDFFYSLGFRKSEEDRVLRIKLNVVGHRYQGPEPANSFLPILNDSYRIKVRRKQNLGREVEKVAMTPITMVGDILILFLEIIKSPFRE